MKNIKNAKIKDAVIFQGKNENLVLTEGMTVILTTDEDGYEKEVAGTIEWITVDCIELDTQENIPLEYIEEISVI